MDKTKNRKKTFLKITITSTKLGFEPAIKAQHLNNKRARLLKTAAISTSPAVSGPHQRVPAAASR